MKNTKKLATSGLLTALTVIFLFIGSVFETLDLSSAALGSIVILIAFIEIGKAWAFGVYFSASLLSLLILPSKTAAIVFTVFAGFYPILKVYLNRIKVKWLSYTARLLCFNIFLSALFLAASELLPLENEFNTYGWIMYSLCNVTFIAYDYALERISITYCNRIRPRIFNKR